MKKLIIAFVIISLSVFGQDKKVKTEYHFNKYIEAKYYSNDSVVFVGNDGTKGVWKWIGKEMFYYRNSEQTPLYKNTFSGDTTFHFGINDYGTWDSLGFKVDFYEPLEIVFDPHPDEAYVTHSGDVIMIKAPEQITKIELIDLSGKIIGVISGQNRSRINIITPFQGILIIRVYYGNYSISEKIELL